MCVSQSKFPQAWLSWTRSGNADLQIFGGEISPTPPGKSSTMPSQKSERDVRY